MRRKMRTGRRKRTSVWTSRRGVWRRRCVRDKRRIEEEGMQGEEGKKGKKEREEEDEKDAYKDEGGRKEE